MRETPILNGLRHKSQGQHNNSIHASIIKMMIGEKITMICFVSCYALALVTEITAYQSTGRRPSWLCRLFTLAGIFAQLLYIVHHALPMSGQSSILMLLSLIMAIFYLSGTFHHHRTALGIFVLPVVLLLLIVHAIKPIALESMTLPPDRSTKMWTWLHLVFILLGDVGLCVAFLASVMYLVQSSFLKHKARPDHALQLLSLERLERMSRRAITLAFPLLTCGLLLGMLLMIQTNQLEWLDSKVISTGLLWLVMVLVIVVRFGMHMTGRKVAWLTVLAFILLLMAFSVSFFLPTGHPTGVLGR